MGHKHAVRDKKGANEEVLNTEHHKWVVRKFPTIPKPRKIIIQQKANQLQKGQATGKVWQTWYCPHNRSVIWPLLLVKGRIQAPNRASPTRLASSNEVTKVLLQDKSEE